MAVAKQPVGKANQGSFVDLLGEGVNEMPEAPPTPDPNDEGNPNNPGGLSNNDLEQRRRLITASGQASAATNAGVPGGLGSSSDPARVVSSNIAQNPQSGVVQTYNYGDKGDDLLRQLALDPSGYGGGKKVVVERHSPEWEDAFAVANPQFNVNELGVANGPNPNAGANVGNAAARGASAGSSAGPYGAIVGGVIGAGDGLRREDSLHAQSQQLGLTALSDDELREMGYSQSMITDYRNRFGQPGSPGTAQAPVQTAAQVSQQANAAPAAAGAPGGTVAGQNSADLIGRGLTAAEDARARGEAVVQGTRAPTNPADRNLQLGAINSAAAIRNGPRAVDTATGANNAMLTGPRAVDTAIGQNNAFMNGPRATDAATGSVQQFQQDPRAQSGVMSQIDQYLDLGEGPSKAQLLLDQANQDAMSDVLSVSRSGRARDAGSQARQAAVAQGEIAGMGVDNARNAGLLRAQETQDSLVRGLQALDTKAGLASSLDTGTLEALGLESTLAGQRDTNTLSALNNASTLAGQRDITSADLLRSNSELAKSRDETGLRATELEGKVATDIRNAGVTDRNNTLSYDLGQDQIEQGLLADLARESGRQETAAGDLRQRQATELTLAEKRKLAEKAAEAQMWDKGTDAALSLLKDEDED